VEGDAKWAGIEGRRVYVTRRWPGRVHEARVSVGLRGDAED